MNLIAFQSNGWYRINFDTYRTKASKCTIIFSLIILLIISGASSLHAATNITKSELDVYLGSEMNKNLPFSWNINLRGTVEFQNMLTIRGGTSVGMEGSFNVDAFTHIGFQLPLAFPISLNTSYIFNAYPDYKTSMHSIIPYIITDLWRFELTLGYGFRFLQFDQSSIHEQSFAYRVCFNMIDVPKGSLSLYLGNFSDFMSGNTLFYHFGLMGDVHIDSRMSLFGSLELMQTGIDGLSSSFYGAALNGGLRICF
jgi:hypothetical protein